MSLIQAFERLEELERRVAELERKLSKPKTFGPSPMTVPSPPLPIFPTNPVTSECLYDRLSIIDQSQ